MHVKNNTICLNRIDWLLIIGLTLAPMTGFRIWKVGFGEIFCMLWGIRFLNKTINASSYILNFFLGFFVCMMCGTIIGTVVAPEELRYTDWFSWIFLALISILLYSGLNENEYLYNCNLLQRFAVVSTYWYFFLYLYSIMISDSFAGVSLWYGNGARYAGGATNPHQVGTLFAVNIFIVLKNIIDHKKFMINFITIVMNFQMLLETKSSTGLLAIFIAFISFALCLPLTRIHEERKTKFIIIEIVFVSLAGLLLFSTIFNTFMNFVQSDANGMGRFELFSYIKDVFAESPILGLGPGMHSRENGYVQEFHNTYIEIFAASGLIGVLFFVRFTVKMIKDIIIDPMTIPIIVSLYSYGLAGFTMRRLIYWGVIIILIVTAHQKYRLIEGNAIETQK